MLAAFNNWWLQFIGGTEGYIGLFLFGIIATTIVPLSPEVMALASWKLGMPPLLAIAILAAGNYLGNSLHYYIGSFGGEWLLEKIFKISPGGKRRTEKLFSLFGPPVLFFAWLPIIGDALTFVPGALRYSFARFTFYTIVGNLVHYLALFWLARAWL